ncbi:MAG TPA: DUF1345 domain-containing protein [Steroidobacteraceae bacterium]|nr:DUF1345 domain-containing protein [Steroidobacteraceae bacterium]
MKGLFAAHPRLWVSTIAGLILFFLLPGEWSTISRVLVAWNFGVLLFLVIIARWMTSLSAQQICSRFVEEDESATVVVAIVTTAALLSLVAILSILSTIKQVTGAQRTAHELLAALTIVDSWLLVPTIFTVQYADLYYSAAEADRPLHFPKTSMPVFWDFAYFSFTIAAACQTSDVSTTQLGIRKVVIAHTLISFLFNASILGFAINVSAGLFGTG